jgi:hypothetical protein
MKVNIALLAAVLMTAVMQDSVVAGQIAKPGKTSGKPQAKTPPIKRPVPVTGKTDVQKVTPKPNPSVPGSKSKAPLTVREALISAGDVLPAYDIVRYGDSKKIDLASLVTGSAVIVLYHPRSKPAVRALSQIASTAAKSKPGIKVYALCVRTDEAVWNASVKTLPTTMLPLWDPAGRNDAGINARKALGTEAYPTIIVTGPDGKVRDAFAGWFSGDRRLAPLLSE